MTARAALRLILRFLAGTALVLMLAIGMLEVTLNGLPFRSPCGWGFGAAHEARQIGFLGQELGFAFSPEVELAGFSCRGFQDLSVTAMALLEAEEGARLLGTLDASFATPSNSLYVQDSAKSARQTVFSDHTEHHYVLPGVGILHVLTVVLTVPHAPSQPWTLRFEGGQF